jgi:two-component system, NarL family, sensor histidine kinase UhpB
MSKLDLTVSKATSECLILLIDDDPDVVWTTTRMLTEAGYAVVSGGSAADALALAHQHRPALVLLDVELPDGNGREVARQIKQDPELAGMFVVLVSGVQISPQQQAEGLHYGLADGYITRPFGKADFLARIEAFLRIRATLEALRLKNLELETFTASVVDYAIIMLDPRGFVMSWNAGAERIKGYRREEIVGRHFSLFYSPDDLQRGLPERGLATAAAEVRFEEEGLRVRKDGSQFIANVVITVLRGANGELSGFSHVVRDITERKLVEEKLATSCLLLQSSIENQKDTILFSIDRDYRYLFFNKAHRSAMEFAYHSDIGIGMNILECVTSGSDKIALRENYDRALAGESHSNVRVFGAVELACYESYFNPVFNDKNEIIGATVLARDITRRVQAEEALKSSEAQLKLFIENAPAALAMFDRDMCYLRASHRWKSDYSLGDRDLLGLSHYDVFPEISAAWKETHRRGLAGEVLREEADCFERRDGTKLWLRWEIQPWYKSAGEIGGIVIFTEDISARKLAEDELREAENALTALNHQLRTLGEHLQTVQEQERMALARDFHDDIGQNLTVLKFDLEWIARRIPEENHEILGRVQEMHASIAELTASVQRIAANLRPIMLDNAGLPAAIEWHVTEFSKRTGLECFTMLNDDIAVQDRNAATAIMRIVQEGLTNVARHSRATEVNISLCRKGCDLLLEISDNGCGINPKQVASLTAYGMMSMQERARMCRGALEITSSPGAGTTLILTIPLDPGECPA